MNRTTCETFGYSAEEMKNLEVGDLSLNQPPYTSAEAVEYIRKAHSQGPQRFEWLAKDKKGRLFWSENNLIHAKIAGKDRTLVFGREIDDRKKAEEALKQSEERYRNLVMQSGDCLLFHDMEGNILDVNPKSCSTYGYPREELLSMKVADLDPDYDKRADKGAFWGAMKPGETVEFEARQRSRDGREFPVEVRLTLVELGGKTLVQGLCRDITGRKQSQEALIIRSLAMEQISDIISVTDLSGNITFINEAVTRVLGRPREDFLGKNVSVFGQDTSQGPTQQEILETTLREGSWRGEVYNDSGSGDIIVQECSTQVVRDQNGEAVALCGISTDITHKKKAEQELRESEEKWRSYVSNAPFGIFIADRQGRYVEVNPAACEITGYSEKELLAMAIPDLMTPGNEEEARAHFQRLLETGSSTGEVGLLHKNGRERRWAVSAVKLSEDRFLGFTEDVTERSRAAEALRQSEERLQAIFNTATNVSFIVTDADDDGPNILEFSPGAENIFGYSREEVIGKPVSMLHVPEDAEKFPEVHAEMREGKRGFDGKTTLVRKSGERFPALFSTYPLFDHDGRMMAGLGVSLDISGQESLQAMLNQSQKMESVGRLAGGVAHDFNNMLSVILGHTEMIMDDMAKDGRYFHDLKEIRSAAKRAADLTRQLLAFARKQTIVPKTLDLNKTVESMLRMLGRLIGEDIDLAWLPGKNLHTVRMDPSQLDQVLANLCVNARDAISGVGKVTIETENVSLDQDYCDSHAGFLPGDYALLGVSDDGCGMDKETAANVFEPFFTTKKTGEGTGLGLSTVYGIVKQNNGLINVYSEPGQGTTFRIYLPCHELFHDGDGQRKTEKIVGGHGETVLLVEDEAAIMRMGRAMLERLGYKVLTAGNPGEAIRLAQENAEKIHLLITDVVMPEMNGRDLAERLQPVNPGMKILYISGYTANVIAHHGVLDKGIHFLQKPFSLAGIASAVSKVLETGGE